MAGRITRPVQFPFPIHARSFIPIIEPITAAARRLRIDPAGGLTGTYQTVLGAMLDQC